MTRIQDQLYMLPVGYVSCTLWETDMNLLEQMNLDVPEDTWTWNDFLELVKQCGEKGLVKVFHSQYCMIPCR